MRLLRARRGTGTAGATATTATGRLIHVGPHKTGTTTVQSAFHRNRGALAEHGIHYVGQRLQPTQAVKAMTGVGSTGTVQEKGLADWERLTAEARTSGRQVVLSSEFLCEADDDVARRIVEDLGGPAETRIVVTLRPMASIVPSQWQQFVQSGTELSLEEWTEAVFDRREEIPSVRLFWLRHRHDVLIRRWAGIVGPENLTAIVCDSRDKDQLTREFARLLALPEGLLVPASQVENRSLTYEEAEAIRAFNAEFAAINVRRAEGDQPRLPLNVDERLAAWRHVKRREPGSEETKIVLPAAAADRVAALAAAMVDDIVDSGVDVVGDLDLLRRVPSADTLAATVAPTSVSPELAARVANGLMLQNRRPG